MMLSVFSQTRKRVEFFTSMRWLMCRILKEEQFVTSLLVNTLLVSLFTLMHSSVMETGVPQILFPPTQCYLRA